MNVRWGGLWVALCLPAMVSAGDWDTAPEAGLLVVVVRHAEKAQNDPRDPDLSVAGQVRANALAERLRALRLAAAYTTPYKRTQQTASPSARAQNIEVVAREFSSRDADVDAAALREELLRDHRGETVLVVGHSNTVPAIVEALSGADADAMPETEYDRLSLIRVEADGSARLRVERF